jgi:hypothetical protein
MPMAAPPVAPNSLTFVERGMEALDETGIADADKLGVIGLISSYTLSEARMANDAARAAARAPADVGDGTAAPWTFEGLLRELVDADTYPHLFRVAWSKDLPRPSSGNEEHEAFLFGLDRILDGVQAFADRAQPASGA